MKQITTKEFADLIGKSHRNTSHSLSMLSLLYSALERASSPAGIEATQRRINRKLRWLGSQYIEHQKIGNQWVVTIKEQTT